MRSIQLVAPRVLESRDMPMPPDPGPGEVLVRLRAVGICGSDMHWYAEGGIGSHRARYPQVLGHEPAAEIVAAGPGVPLRPGQKVAVEPSVTCGHCEYCLTGHSNNCIHGWFMGSPEMPGAFREYATIPAHNAFPVPDSMSFIEATIIEPLAVIVHVLEMVRIRLGDTVAVMGAGPIGLLTAAAARAAGASRVFIADKVPHRLRLAESMGADVAVDLVSLAPAVLDHTRGRGVDVVFDAAGAAATINTAVAIARLGGQVVLIGIPSESVLPIDVITAMGKELNIQTIKRSAHNDAGALALLESGRIPAALITHRLPLEETPRAFRMLETYEDGVGKAVIEIS